MLQTRSNRISNQPIIGVKRKLWRKDDEHADDADAAFAKVRTKVLQRDNYTCQFCGFKSAKYQEIHHINDNHQKNELKNLITACNLCHQVHHLGMCAMHNSGFISAIPELTQTEVNNLVRAIHVSELVADTVVKHKLTSLFAILQYRGFDTLKEIYGVDISNPYALAETLSNCPDEIYLKRKELFAPLRLVGTKDAFHAGQIEYYANNHRALFRPENWLPLTRQLNL
jgi:intracellular multiplication protein IcmJ